MVGLGAAGRKRTEYVIQRLRGFRGRLTRHQIAAALGADDAHGYKAVCRLLRTHGIAAAKDAARRSPDPPRSRNEKNLRTDAALAEAKRQLAAEIARHHDRLRLGLVPPPYKPGPLQW